MIDKVLQKLFRHYRNRIERYVIYHRERWIVSSILLFIYVLRVYLIEGFFVISYVLGLYLLHLFVRFFTPVGLPDVEDDENECSLPVTDETNDQNPEERGPLIRNMNEFAFWQQFTIGVILSILCTSSRLFDLPVFWPFLVFYFILLVVLTLKRLFKHMKKYGYTFKDFTKKMNKWLCLFLVVTICLFFLTPPTFIFHRPKYSYQYIF